MVISMKENGRKTSRMAVASSLLRMELAMMDLLKMTGWLIGTYKVCQILRLRYQNLARNRTSLSQELKILKKGLQKLN